MVDVRILEAIPFRVGSHYINKIRIYRIIVYSTYSMWCLPLTVYAMYYRSAVSVLLYTFGQKHMDNVIVYNNKPASNYYNYNSWSYLKTAGMCVPVCQEEAIPPVDQMNYSFKIGLHYTNTQHSTTNYITKTWLEF